jgi:hypothetical protein
MTTRSPPRGFEGSANAATTRPSTCPRSSDTASSRTACSATTPATEPPAAPGRVVSTKPWPRVTRPEWPSGVACGWEQSSMPSAVCGQRRWRSPIRSRTSTTNSCSSSSARPSRPRRGWSMPGSTDQISAAPGPRSSRPCTPWSTAASSTATSAPTTSCGTRAASSSSTSRSRSTRSLIPKGSPCSSRTSPM